ncbi:MAG TPA: AAA family ATPase [Acetobacteraceae bacterium]|nr:AAA family ATPase [Acetobacteraceae bacterium]
MPTDATDMAPPRAAGRLISQALRTDAVAADLSPAAAFSVLRRHRLLLAICLLSFPTLAWIALSRTPPRYTATGTVLYDPRAYTARVLKSILRVDPTTDAVMQSQAEILQSLGIAQQVADRMHLADRPEFNAMLAPPSALARLIGTVQHLLGRFRPPPPPDNAAIAAAVDQAVQAAIHAVPLRNSRVLAVSFAAENPAVAAKAANLVMQAYIDGQMARKTAVMRRATAWMQHRVIELRAHVAKTEGRIAAFRAQAGLAQGVRAGLTTERISRLDADLVQAKADLARAQAAEDALHGGAGEAARAALSGSVVTLRAEQARLAGELQSFRARFGPDYPRVVALRRQLAAATAATAAETGRVRAAARARLRAAVMRVADLSRALADAQAQQGANAWAEIPLRAMRQDAAAARSLLQAVLGRIQQTAQQGAIEKPDARILSRALPPGAPSWPPRALLLAAATAFGLFFGLMLVALLEVADNTFRSGEDVRAALALPCLALVPQIRRAALGRLPLPDYVARRPLSPFAEQMRTLRAALWLGAARPRLVAITAARPSEGKTITTLALARSAAMNGERVIVLDCDMRQPSLGRMMGAGSGPGLIDHLAGAASLAQIIRHDPLTGLSYIVAGAAEAKSLGLFMSAPMTALLKQLQDAYDLVLLDAPPALAMADARIVAHLADATVLCIRWRDTPRRVAQDALDKLAEAGVQVAGAVLTRVDARAHVRSGFVDSEVYHPRYGGYVRE